VVPDYPKEERTHLGIKETGRVENRVMGMGMGTATISLGKNRSGVKSLDAMRPVGAQPAV
jgi:hypothetical protein